MDNWEAWLLTDGRCKSGREVNGSFQASAMLATAFADTEKSRVGKLMGDDQKFDFLSVGFSCLWNSAGN